MYVILVNNDNTLSAPVKERIMQRSKLVDTLCFLSNPIYKGYDMTSCTVLLEYLLPVSKKYCSDILTLSEERYEEFLKYLLPFDTDLTSEAGKIELQLTFIYTDLDDKGNPIQRVRKTSTISIDIIPISAWSDIIPDSALTTLDQRIIKMDAQIKSLNDTAMSINDTKADNINYNPNSNELQLMAGDKLIGNKVALKSCSVDKDGIPVVDFYKSIGDDFEDDADLRDVVLF